MTNEGRQKLRELAVTAARATPLDRSGAAVARWQLQTSNSFRRIGTDRGDGDVLCAVTQRSDGHPDLHAAPGVLDYIVAADPRAVLELLDELDHLRPVVEALGKHADRYQTSRDLKEAVRTYRQARRDADDWNPL